MARKYKNHAASLKIKVALEAIVNEKMISKIIFEHQASSSQMTEWKVLLLEEAEKLIKV